VRDLQPATLVGNLSLEVAEPCGGVAFFTILTEIEIDVSSHRNLHNDCRFC